MDSMYVKTGKTITRSGLAPLIERLVAKTDSNNCLSIENGDIRDRSQGRYLTNDGIEAIANILVEASVDAIEKLLLVLDRKVMGHETELEEIKSRYGFAAGPWELFLRYSTEKEQFFVDEFIEANPDYIDEIVGFFNQQDRFFINRENNEELSAVVIYSLFGRNALDYEMVLGRFLSTLIIDILNQSELSGHLAAFAQRLDPLIKQEIEADEESFRRRLGAIEEDSIVTSPLVIYLPPTIYLMQVKDENDQVLNEYLGIYSYANRNDFEKIVGFFDTGEESVQSDTQNIGFFKSEHLLSDVGDHFYKDLIWFELPQVKMGGRKIRELFSEFNSFREDIEKKRFSARQTSLSQIDCIALIEFNGLYGVNRRTAAEIVDDPTLYDEIDVVSENAVSQLQARSKYYTFIDFPQLFRAEDL